MRKHDYLLSGSFAIDTIERIHGLFSAKILPEAIDRINVAFGVAESHSAFGGTGGNIAYNARLLDDSPMLVGSLGKDSDEYIDWLRQNGLHTDTLTIHWDSRTAHARIITDENDNQITSFNKGAMANLPMVLPETPDLWHLAPDTIETTVHLAGLCQARGHRYFLDPGQALPAFLEANARGELSEPLGDLLINAEGIFLNEYEEKLLEAGTGKDASYWLRDGQFLVRTQGAQGLTIMTKVGDGEISTHLPPAPTVKTIDPTGCGDALRAGFLSGFVAGWSPLRCARLGSVMGSFAIEAQGGQAHRPTQEQILKRLATYGESSLPNGLLNGDHGVVC